MYFLALAALLAINEYAPKIIAPPTDLVEREKAAGAKNLENKELLAAQEGMGARYVCLKLVLPSA